MTARLAPAPAATGDPANWLCLRRTRRVWNVPGEPITRPEPACPTAAPAAAPERQGRGASHARIPEPAAGRPLHNKPERSEERRVGKEGRSRWAPDDTQKEGSQVD